MHYFKKYLIFDIIALVPFYILELFRHSEFILENSNFVKFFYLFFYFKYSQFDQKIKILKEVVTLDLKLYFNIFK